MTTTNPATTYRKPIGRPRHDGRPPAEPHRTQKQETIQTYTLPDGTPKPTCIIYSRFSPRRNADKSESCEVQEAYCEEYAFKQGYHVRATYNDKALSGADENRPGLWQAIDSLQKDEILLVYRRDRLARNVYLAEVINRDVGKLGAKIESVSGDVDGDGPEAILIRQVLSSISEYERKITAMRTKAAMLHKQANGQRMGRFAPYGFSIDPDDRTLLTPNPAEQEVIAEMIAKSERGDNGSDIMRWLNAERRDMCRGQRWQLVTVLKILKREKQC